MRRLCASTVVLLTCALLPCSLAADDAPLHFAGVVLYPDGSPAAGAKVWLVDVRDGVVTTTKTATTGADGRFEFTAPELDTTTWTFYQVCARAPEYAFGWTSRLYHADAALRIVLEPEIELHGVILDAAGEPTAGIRPHIGSLYRAVPFDPQRIGEWDTWLSLPPGLEDQMVTQTDAEGAFTVRHVPAGVALRVSVDDPGGQYGFADFDWVDFAAATPFTIRLMRCGTVRGRVTDAATGEPVVGVCIGVAFGARLHATTDAEGRYEIAMVPEGRWSVRLHETPTQFTAVGVSGVEVKSGEVTDGTDLQLIPGLEIRGSVTEAATGKPLADVALSWTTRQTPEDGGSAPVVTTGADGTYSLRAPEGAVELYPQSMPTGWRPAKTGGDVFERFTLTADNAPYVVDFRAVRARSLAGRVLGPDGAPVAHAGVLLLQERGHGIMQDTPCDAEGRFRFENLEPDSRCMIHAYCGDDMTLEPVMADRAQTADVELRLNRGVRPALTGRVTSATGEAIPGALVRFDFVAPDPPAPWGSQHWSYMTHALTDVEGRFEVLACWPGMKFRTETRAAHSAERVDAHEPLLPGERRDLGDIVLEPAPLAITGITVDEHGRPMANVSVEVEFCDPKSFSRMRRVTSDAHGRFSFESLPAERLVVRADPFRFSSAWVEFGPETPDGDITLTVIPRDRQMLFSHLFSTPPEAEAEKLKARLVQICRFKGFDMEGTLHQYLGLGLEVETAAEEVRYPGVWVIDDQGRELERAFTECLPFTADCTRVFELPQEGVQALGRIGVGASGPTTRVPDGDFTRMHVFDPIVSGQHIAVLQSAEIADDFIEPREPGKAQSGKGPYIRARVYLACDETTRYRLTSAQSDAGIELHEAWSFEYRQGVTELDLPAALEPMQADLLAEARSALRLLPQLAPGGRTMESVQCIVLQSLGDHEQFKAPEWIGLTVSPCSVPDAFTVVFENIPIPPELTKAVEME